MRICNTHYTKSKQKQTQNNAYSCEYALVVGFSDKKLKINIFHYKFYIYLTKLSLKHTLLYNNLHFIVQLSFPKLKTEYKLSINVKILSFSAKYWVTKFLLFITCM